jgi:NADH:ubiquinone reductase (H+-translocating)
MQRPTTNVPEVVVVGAGFGGLSAATRLRRDAEAGRLRLTLVDRHAHHVFQPLLYQVATAALQPQDIGHSVRAMLPPSERVRFRRGEVAAIDPERRRLVLADGAELAWDQLVLAVGAEPSDRGVPGVREHGFQLKSLGDARRLRNHLLRQFEDVAADRAGAEALHVVVCGGGPTGVELAGALAELTCEVLAREFGLDSAPIRITLLQRGDRLLPSFGPAASRYARAALERRGVTVRTDTQVAQVHPSAIVLGDGEVVPTRTVVWCAGVRPSALPLTAGLAVDGSGRVALDADLTVPGRPDIHVVGDAAGPVDGLTQPQLATVAMQQGRHVAAQIRRRLAGQPTRPFRYRSVGQWATIGRNLAVVELARGRIRLRGVVAWALWGVAHLVRLAGARNRASVALNWVWSYLTHDRAARLILEDEPARVPVSPPAPATEPTLQVSACTTRPEVQSSTCT